MRTIISQNFNTPEPDNLIVQDFLNNLKKTGDTMEQLYHQLRLLAISDKPELQPHFQTFGTALGKFLGEIHKIEDTLSKSNQPQITEHDINVDRFNQKKNDWKLR